METEKEAGSINSKLNINQRERKTEKKSRGEKKMSEDNRKCCRLEAKERNDEWTKEKKSHYFSMETHI